MKYYIFLGDPYADCLDVKTCANCRGTGGRAQFRTLDGTCNNINKPTQGAADTKHKRYLGTYLTIRCILNLTNLIVPMFMCRFAA